MLLTDRQKDLLDLIKRGYRGEVLIDSMIKKGYYFSRSTKDREVKKIKKELGVMRLK